MNGPVKKLYLATVTDGVVEFEGPASDQDVAEFGWTKANGEVVRARETIRHHEGCASDHGEWVDSCDCEPVKVLDVTTIVAKEANGSNGYVEIRDTERPPRKKPSDRLRELLTAGPPKVHGSAFAAVDWALEIVGAYLDEREA